MNTSHMEEFDVIEIYLRHGDYPIGRYQYIKDKKIMVAVLPVQQRLQVHWLTCGVIAIALKGHGHNAYSRRSVTFKGCGQISTRECPACACTRAN